MVRSKDMNENEVWRIIEVLKWLHWWIRLCTLSWCSCGKLYFPHMATMVSLLHTFFQNLVTSPSGC